jgi:hypothetical protein
VQCVDELQQQIEGLKEDNLRLVDEAAAARELIESAQYSRVNSRE